MSIVIEDAASVRVGLRRILQQLDTAEACVAALRAAMVGRDPVSVAATWCSAHRAWHRAGVEIAALETLCPGSATPRYVQDLLRASRGRGSALWIQAAEQAWLPVLVAGE
jgi:hypothetical protein